MQEPQERQVPSLGMEVSLEGDMAIHSSILAWIIPWTEETGGVVNGIAESDTTN